MRKRFISLKNLLIIFSLLLWWAEARGKIPVIGIYTNPLNTSEYTPDKF